MTIDPTTLTAKEIHEATSKILADPLLHRFYGWSISGCRALFAAPEKAEPEPKVCPNCGCRMVKPHWSSMGLTCTCQPAQPEPAAPVGNEDCLKAKAEGPWLAEVLAARRAGRSLEQHRPRDLQRRDYSLPFDMPLQEVCRVSEDTAWLIEHTHDPRYGRESWYSGKDGFTIDSLQAVRFARKEDALREIDRFPTTLAKNLIAAHHAWIPARVCPHGQLQRQCEICEAKEEAAHWRSKAETAFEPIRKIADALAQGGFHCHDKPGFIADHVPGLVSEAVTELKIKREEKERLTIALEAQCRRLSALWDGEKVLRERAGQKYAAEIDAAKIEAADLRSRLNHLGDSWRLIDAFLLQSGHESGRDGLIEAIPKVELPKVRIALGTMKAHFEPSCQGHCQFPMAWAVCVDALAELNAAEGKAETKEEEQ